NPSARCCIRVHGRSASPRACGRSRWLPRSVSPRASLRGWSATKPFVWLSAGWGCPGSVPSIGLPAPIRPIPDKKTTRPADPAGDGPADVGAGLWRRSLVESAGPARPTLLDGRRCEAQVTGVDPAYGRSRSQGAGLLWTAGTAGAAPGGPDVA